MKRFLSRLDAILENVGGPTSGKVDILHKSGKHIIADHVKKVRSPNGGRLVLMAGIGPPVAPSDGPYWRDVQEILRNSWTYRLRDFYVPYRQTGTPTARDVLLIGSATPGQLSSMKYMPMGRSLRIKKKFKHVLVIDMRNVISINGQAVQQPQDIQQQPSAGLEQPQALNEAQEQQTTTDYAKLGFPPMATTPVGRYFLTANGDINYQLNDASGKKQTGSTHPENFKLIYKKYFEQHLKSEDIIKFTNFYIKNMTNDLDKSSTYKHPYPSYFNSQNAKWVADGNNVIYKINGKNGIATPEEFDAIYNQNKHSF